MSDLEKIRALRAQHPGWCDDCCLLQYELDAKRARSRGIVASGGFYTPLDSIYQTLYSGEGCHLWEDRPLKWYREVYGRKEGKREWKEDRELVGTTVHAFVPPIELPRITVNRGGIQYVRSVAQEELRDRGDWSKMDKTAKRATLRLAKGMRIPLHLIAKNTPRWRRPLDRLRYRP